MMKTTCCIFLVLFAAASAWPATDASRRMYPSPKDDAIAVRPFTEPVERPLALQPLALSPLFNGSFEYSSGYYFTAWDTYRTGLGGWTVQTGTSAPSGFSCSGTTVPAPTDGTRAAMSMSSNPGVHILSQDLPSQAGPQIVAFDLFIKNFAPAFYSPATLDPAAVPNQQFRADILSPIVAITDTTEGVLRNLYATRPGDPLTSGYTRITRSYFGLPFQDTRIRFAETDTEHCLMVGLDNLSIVPVRPGDFNHDLKADVFWRNSTTGQNVLWTMNGTAILSALPTNTVADLNYKVAGIGDLDANGTADVVWRHDLTGQVVVWLMEGAVPYGGIAGTVGDLNWRIEAVADVDGDAKADLIWRKITTGEVAVWFMNGASLRAAASIGTVSDLGWRIAGTGDLNGDGRADLIWRNGSTGANAVWMMYGSSMAPMAMTTVADTHWKIAAVADFTLDGKGDLLWRNDVTGQVVLWAMSYTGIDFSSVVGTVSDLNWNIEAVGDFNGDGLTDVFWRQAATGQTVVWRMGGGTIYGTAALTTVSDLHWSAVGPR